MRAALVVLALALLAPLAVDAAEGPSEAEQAEIRAHLAWLQRESGWFTVRHPDPVAAARSEPLERVREDCCRILNANLPLLPARKPLLLATAADATVPASVRFALAYFLTQFHHEVGLDREERLRADGILQRELAYDYARAMRQLTVVILRDFRGQPASAVIAGLRAAGWTTTDDDITYAVEVVAPTVHLQ